MRIKLTTFLAAAAGIFLIEWIFGALLSGIPSRLHAVLIIRVMETVFLLSLIRILEKKRYDSWFDRLSLLNGLKTGLLWSAAFGGIVLAALVIASAFKINILQLIKAPLPSDPHQLAFFFLTGGIVAPACEELFFRGIIYGFFRRWGILFALCLSTAIFGALHLAMAAIPVPQLIGGIVFALSYEKSKNIAAPIIIHSLGNLAIFGISFMGHG